MTPEIEQELNRALVMAQNLVRREQETRPEEVEQMRAALDLVANAKLGLGRKIQAAVEEICNTYEGSGILPHVTVETRPQDVYGGTPRGIRAFVTVEFTTPNPYRPHYNVNTQHPGSPNPE